MEISVLFINADQGAFTAKEALSKQVGRMTHRVDVSRHLLSATSVLVQKAPECSSYSDKNGGYA